MSKSVTKQEGFLYDQTNKKVKKYVEALDVGNEWWKPSMEPQQQQTTFKFSIEFWPEVKGLNFRLRISKGKVSRVVIHYCTRSYSKK